MVHRMGLYEDYFHAMEKGDKKVEVRLNDEKRRKINVADTIEFIKLPGQNGLLKVQVTELRTYGTFEEMYKDIPLRDFDCEGWSMKDMIDGTYDIYTPEQERKWGTLAITVRRL
ncbi:MULTISPECIES: ASCH domain-containing protein [Bacillaceae]|uniref:ASCH domain-containing protein n=1 Tax=Evansella alkalicola TaxID=745819 RepID=A0ABS6JPG2_9BACI|nr:MULTISPECIES: ASCH domain-containing protein [Bacillaceae]MBU9720378.1 ASCH domain-containing protein [Bacillus alkalicola]